MGTFFLDLCCIQILRLVATVNFYYRGKSDTGNLTIRLKHSTSIDYRISSKIVSSRKYWYKTNNKHRKLDELSYLDANAKLHKEYLEKVQQEILLRFKNDFNTGVPISKEWFIRNTHEITNILLAKDEIKNAQSDIDKKELERLKKEREAYNKNLVVSAINRVIEVEYFDNKDQIKIYRQLLNKINAYQEAKKVKVQIKDVTQNFIDEFTAFLMNDLKHQISTARKHCKSLVHAVKYQKNAFPDIVQLSEGIREITYKKQSNSERRKTRAEIVVTLSFDELDQIHRTEVPRKLLNAKKIILFGCEVGLRVSDYNKLTETNIKEVNGMKYWSFWNTKTGTDIVIPITQRIINYIDCYGMPKTEYNKTADVIINREIKEVCELARIDEQIQGRKSQTLTIKGKDVRRTVSMKYPKWQLITTHSFRRSFATNYYNTLKPHEIRQITGHSSDAQLMEYINQDKDRTEIIKQMADKMNSQEVERKNKTVSLKVVKEASNS